VPQRSKTVTRLHAGTALAGVVALAVASLVACGSDDYSGIAPPGSDAPAGEAGEGAATFRANCASCHAADGSGGHGPKIGDGTAAGHLTVEQMRALVANGRGSMPGFAGRLTAEEIAAVVAFVRDDLRSAPKERVKVGEGPRGTLSGLPPELDPERLGRDWPVMNGDLTSNRARLDSPITTETIGDLELAWTYRVPKADSIFGNLPTNPIVSGDTVYAGDLTGRVYAIDRESGEERFTTDGGAPRYGPTGVGIGYGRLYAATANERGAVSVLVAYDAATGEELWQTDIGANGSEIDVQPVVYDGLVFASTAGTGAGSRGTVYAVDAETGTVVWDFPVIEDPTVWGNPDLNNGGGVWYPPAIDTERRIAYFGTGNPYPFPGIEGFPNGTSRPGDNRWTDSMLALDLDTGNLVWGHQARTHDIFDLDQVLAARADVEIDGEERSVAVSSGKSGVVYGLDAETGERLWRTEVGIHQNDDLDEIDGPTEVYPGIQGGVLTPLAIADGTVYVVTINAATTYEGPETPPGQSVALGSNDAQVVAIDLATGEIRWDVKLNGDSFGAATVSGDLLVTSTFTGEIVALDRATGEQVWSYDAPGPHQRLAGGRRRPVDRARRGRQDPPDHGLPPPRAMRPEPAGRPRPAQPSPRYPMPDPRPHRRRRHRRLAGCLLPIVLVSAACSGGSSDGAEEPTTSTAASTGGPAVELDDTFPGAEWEVVEPRAAGVDPALLERARDYAFAPGRNTQGVVVVHRGRIVAEWYDEGADADSWAASWSMAKSINATLIGIAVDEGDIPSVDVPVSRYVDEWVGTDKEAITLRDLLQMTSGLDWVENYEPGQGHSDIIQMVVGEEDELAYARSRPLAVEPGTRFNYSSGDSMILGQVLEEATGQRLADYAREKLADPLGMGPFEWWQDVAGNTLTCCCFDTTSRDFARFGLLYLHGGSWEDRQIVSGDWVEASLEAGPASDGAYGYQWWVGVDEGLPDDIIQAKGIDGQYIYVLPSQGLVVVRNGTYVKDPGPPVADPSLFPRYPSGGLMPGKGTSPPDEWDSAAFLEPIIEAVDGA